MNATSLENLYSNLEISTNDDINAVTLSIEGIKRLLLLAKFENDEPHILVEASEGYLELKGVNGIGIVNKKFVLEEIKQSNFYDYYCKHEKYKRIFFPFMLDILTKLGKGYDIIKSHNTSVKLWKHFFDDPDSAFMPIENEIGLIGELIYLGQLLNFDENAIESWRGPEGGVDFISEKLVVEVKTTLRNQHVHTINGMDQLEPISELPFYLLSNLLQVLEQKNDKSITLAEVYQEVQEKISGNPIQLDLLKGKIKALNLTHELIKLHNFRHYIILDSAIYSVDDSMPKLTSHDLNKPLSYRISKVRYDIDLDGLPYLHIIDFLNKFFGSPDVPN